MVSMTFYKKKKPLTWRLLLLEIIKEYAYSACPTPPLPPFYSVKRTKNYHSKSEGLPYPDHLETLSGKQRYLEKK